MKSAIFVGPVYRFARYLSVVGHPYVVLPASVAAVSLLRGGGVRAAAGVAGMFVVLSVFVLLGIRSGRFNDFDVSERERRPRFYVLVTAGTAALAVWLREDPAALRACIVAGALLLACGLLNRSTKPSLHTAFSLYAAGFWGAWSSIAGLVVLPLAALVAWSRVHLGRHTAGEVWIGAALGLVAAALLLACSPG